MGKTKLFAFLLIATFSLQLNSMNHWYIGEGVEENEFDDLDLCYIVKRIEYNKLLEKVKKAIKYKSINEKPYLCQACFWMYADIAELLIKNGADLEKPYSLDKKDITPLNCAIRTRSKDLLELLLGAGAKIKKGDLILACSMDNVAIVRLLLNNSGAIFVNELNEKEQETPLISAVINISKKRHQEQYEIVKLLLSYGADIFLLGDDFEVNNAYEAALEKLDMASDKYKEPLRKLANLFEDFINKSKKLTNYLSNKSEDKPEINIDLLEVFLMRLVCAGNFENLFKFINAYKGEIDSLPKDLKLLSNFIVNFYQNKFNLTDINSILLGRLDDGNSLELEAYKIAKNKGFKKFGQFIRMACLLNKFKIPEDTKRLISIF